MLTPSKTIRDHNTIVQILPIAQCLNNDLLKVQSPRTEFVIGPPTVVASCSFKAKINFFQTSIEVTNYVTHRIFSTSLITVSLIVF